LREAEVDVKRMVDHLFVDFAVKTLGPFRRNIEACLCRRTRRPPLARDLASCRKI
jgi:hypothetical protein